MPKLTKPFVIATEGPTIDGRNISREWLQQMAASYDPKAYTAVANLEHLLSLSPDSLFSAYGKVVRLATQEAELMGEKKLQLTAVVEVDDALITMQQAGKKLFASMEVVANFAGKGIAYLTGLAFTDRPASLGTESMKFSAKQDGVFSFDDELSIEFAEESEVSSAAGETLFARVKALLGGKEKKDAERFADSNSAIEAIAASQRDALNRLNELPAEFAKVGAAAAAAQTAADKVAADLVAFQQQLDATPAGDKRRPATGGGDHPVTDC